MSSAYIERNAAPWASINAAEPKGSDESSRGGERAPCLVRVHGAISRLRRRIAADTKRSRSIETFMTSRFVVGFELSLVAFRYNRKEATANHATWSH